MSIVVARIVRSKSLRKKLKIPEPIQWTKETLPAGLTQQKGFRESIREGKSYNFA